jgi:(p)ppGpp synthase/HD superfamily hydrolase
MGKSYSELLDRALIFAAQQHRGQLRKDRREEIPYVAHACAVGVMLLRAGWETPVAAAGFLHDVLEDSETTRAELEARFGAEVATLVDWVSEQDKSLPWSERKAAYLERLARAPEQARAISLADKIHNLQSLIRALDAGESIWGVFNSGPREKLDYYRRVLAICADSADPRLRAMSDEARPLLERLAAAVD